MASYESVIGILEAELTAVTDVFTALTPDQWQRSTLLMPVDPDLPKWTVFELAGHFDIAIGLTRTLIAEPADTQPGRDRTSFFINPRSETGPVVYSYAYTLAQALAVPYFATADGIAATAAILDDLLTRRTTGRRPAALADDLDWILAASGRAPADDSRLPLIG